MPRTYSTAAVVLGSHKFGDADRVVTLFTAELGKTPTVVKGVRKVKSKFGGRLEPFTHLQVQLHAGRNLHTLTGADTLRTHAILRDTPAALQAGTAFIEMLARASTDFEQRSRTFNLVVNYLDVMDEVAYASREEAAGAIRDESEPGGRQEPAPAANPVFTVITLGAELKLLLLSGFLPHLADCSVCGSDGALPKFSAQAGGALCDSCAGDAFRISGAALETMRELLEKPLADAAQTPVDEVIVREVWRAIREVCRYHLGTDLRVEPW